MKKYTLLLSITLLLVLSCERKNSNYKYDKSKVVLLPSKKNTFIPTDEELILADDIVLKRMGIYNVEQETFNIDRNYMFGDTIHYISIRFE